MIGAHRERSEREVLVSIGLDVFVEQHVVGSCFARCAAAMNRVALAFFGAACVPPCVFAYRCLKIGFEHARFDLFEHSLNECRLGCEELVGIAILGLEVGNGVGIFAVA